VVAKKKSKKSEHDKAFSNKVSELVGEGYKQKQAVAIAYSEDRSGGTKRLKQSHGGKRKNKRDG
jgi:hypothetical protein